MPAGIGSSHRCLVSFSKSSTNNSSFLLHRFARKKKYFYVSRAILSAVISKGKCSGKMTKESEYLQHIPASSLTRSGTPPLFYVLCATVSTALLHVCRAVALLPIPMELPGTARPSGVRLGAELTPVAGRGMLAPNEAAGAQMRERLNKLRAAMPSIAGGCFRDTGWLPRRGKRGDGSYWWWSMPKRSCV